MGKVFKEYIDYSFKSKCLKCNVDLYVDINDLYAETCMGKCKIVSSNHVYNIITNCNNTSKSFLHMSNNIFMFDYDVCLETIYVQPTIDVNCRNCNTFLGWKYLDTYILLT